MARTYRVTLAVRVSNAAVVTLLPLGVTIGPMALLTVPGRKSGRPRTSPVALVERDGRRWLVAPFGDVNWVRNLRAAGAGTLTRGRRAEAITAVELSPQEAALVLKQSLAFAPAFLRSYFDVTPAPALEDFEREAPRHPVFEVRLAAAARAEDPRRQAA